MDFDQVYGPGGFFSNPDNRDKMVNPDGTVETRSIVDIRSELVEMVDQFVESVNLDNLDNLEQRNIRNIQVNLDKLDRPAILDWTDFLVAMYRKYQV